MARREASGELLGHGIMGGLLGGAIFALGQIVVSATINGGPLVPWKLFASILLGEAAITQPLTPGVFLVGFFTHFFLAAFFGCCLGALSQLAPRDVRANWAAHSALGMSFGILLWAFNFHLVAPMAYPWFLQSHPLAQILLHALGFGWVAAMYITAHARVPAFDHKRRAFPRRTTA